MIRWLESETCDHPQDRNTALSHDDIRSALARDVRFADEPMNDVPELCQNNVCSVCDLAWESREIVYKTAEINDM